MNCKRKSALTTKVGGGSTPSSAMANSLQLLSRWTFLSSYSLKLDRFLDALASLDFKLSVINIISVMIVLIVINLFSCSPLPLIHRFFGIGSSPIHCLYH